MKLWLDDQKPTQRFDEGGDLIKKAGFIWDLMDHVECQGKIDLFSDAYPVRPRLMQEDLRFQSSIFALSP